MLEKKGSLIDRRSGKDRRRAHSLDYFLHGGLERRGWKVRRSEVERRVGWIKVNKWCSVNKRELKL